MKKHHGLEIMACETMKKYYGDITMVVFLK